MSVICTVDSSEYWLQLCKKSAKGVVESYKDLKDKLIDTVYVKNSLLIDDLGSLLSQRDSVIVAVAPPFLCATVMMVQHRAAYQVTTAQTEHAAADSPMRASSQWLGGRIPLSTCSSALAAGRSSPELPL